MAYPTIEGVGAQFASAGGANATCVLPAHVTNDILVIAVENETSTILTFAQNTAGFVELARVGNVHVWWVRATSAAMTNPSVTCETNHQIGSSLCIRGCPTTGNPWDVLTARSFTATSSWSWDEVTTTVAEALIILIGGADRDNTGEWMGALTNANLASLTQHFDSSITTNLGGGLYIGSGTKATAGATGATTGTAAASYSGAIHTIAFKPVGGAPAANTTNFFALLGD